MVKKYTREEAIKWSQEFADHDLPSVLAWSGDEPWGFLPEQCETDYLVKFVAGDYDSMNEGNDEVVAKERDMARAELRRRGVEAPLTGGVR